MPLFANNMIVKEGEYVPPPIPKVEKKVVPKPQPKILQGGKSWHEIYNELINVDTKQKVETVQPIVEEKKKPKYHETHDGDLHKLINRQSSYLTDMIDLKD